MESDLNLDTVRMALLADGFVCTAEARGVLRIDAERDALLDRAVYRGCECLRVRYRNTNGARGTWHGHLQELIGVLHTRAANGQHRKSAEFSIEDPVIPAARPSTPPVDRT